MKKIILSFAVLLASTASFAQKDSTQIKKQLLDTLCKCLANTDTATLKSSDAIQTAVMTCFMTDGMGLFMEYAQAKGIDMEDENAGRVLGEEIGKQLVIDCAAFRKIMLKVLMDQSKDKKEPSKKE